MTEQKNKFRIAEDVTYLNTAFSAPLSKEAEKIGIEALSKKCNPNEYNSSDFFEPPEILKKKFAQLIDTSNHQNIAIIPSVSYGIATVANNIYLKENDEILVVGDQFPSNIYSWQKIATKYNAVIKTIFAPKTKQNRGKKWNENILSAINSKTAVISIPIVHWSDGTIFNLKMIREKATKNNSLLIIDGTQSIGALPFSVNESKPDALICAGYKWLMGPYAIGLAYYGEYFKNGNPIEENWINRKKSEDFTNLVDYQDQYKEYANRYNMGAMSNFNLVPILTTSIEQILKWKPDNIQNYCKEITRGAIEELREMHCTIEDDKYRSNHLFGVKLAKNMDINRLQKEFQFHNVFVSIRGEYVRVSPHVFNTKEDLDKLVNCFKLSRNF